METENSCPLLSFILPVYRVEAYLPRCLDSILGQMDDRCEMVLVDDGSPDGSGRICDEYAGRDSRIRVCHKENGGPAMARNDGLDLARGEYICYIDADDYIAENRIPALLNWIETEKKDICFLRIRKVYPDGQEEPIEDAPGREALRGRSREEVLRTLAKQPSFAGSPCAKLLRRKMLLDHQVEFPRDRRLSEDLIFCLDAYLAADSFDCLEFPFYYYRQDRAGSNTSEISPKYYFDTFLFVEEAAERFGSSDRRETAEGELALSAAAFEYAILVWQVLALRGEAADRALEKLRKYRWVLSYGRCYKTKLTRAAMSFLGIRGAAGLMDFYQKVRR